MHSTIEELSSLERNYLNAVWQYHRYNSSTDKDAAVSKEVFRLIKAGLYELAAVEAGKSDVALEIWTSAVAASRKEGELIATRNHKGNSQAGEQFYGYEKDFVKAGEK